MYAVVKCEALLWAAGRLWRNAEEEVKINMSKLSREEVWAVRCILVLA